MSLFSRSRDPAWLVSARAICRAHGITIVGWGPRAIVVEAGTPERAAEISARFADLGFQPVPDSGDEEAGILTLAAPTDGGTAPG
jgi:hypothetical protein